MSSEKLFKVTGEWSKKAKVNKDEYEKLYKHSITNNIEFWDAQAKRVDWFSPYTKIKDVKYSSSEVHIKWYYDGILNASFNCVDRHAKQNPNKTNIQW